MNALEAYTGLTQLEVKQAGLRKDLKQLLAGGGDAERIRSLRGEMWQNKIGEGGLKERNAVLRREGEKKAKASCDMRFYSW